MFQELEKYKENDSFIFSLNDELGDVCNAPDSNNKAGIYLVYDLTHNELIYIGISGQLQKGVFKFRKDGIKGRLVKGKQFEERKARKIAWKIKMKEDKIQKLKVDWYVTYDEVFVFDYPEILEAQFLKEFKKDNDNKLPKWNKSEGRKNTNTEI